MKLTDKININEVRLFNKNNIHEGFINKVYIHEDS